MQNLSKRQWGPQLSIKESADLMIEWCIRAREKNVLRKSPPSVFYAYILDDTPPLNFYSNVSQLFKYSQKDTPYIDSTRDKILRCLSVSLKAHFFLFPTDKVSYEPYFFNVPNFESPNNSSFGLIYKVEHGNKCIIVSEVQLGQLFAKSKVLFEFNVVVGEDSFKWFSLKSWLKVKQEHNISDMVEKPWLSKKLHQQALEAKTQEELSQVASVLDVPYDLKDKIKPLGIEWSKNVKTWFLPKGFDVDSVNEYINYLKKHPQE